MFQKIPEITKTWWPSITALVFTMGLIYSGFTYIIQIQAKELVKNEITPEIKDISKSLKEQEKTITDLQKQNSVTDAKLDLLIKMLESQNKLLKKD